MQCAGALCTEGTVPRLPRRQRRRSVGAGRPTDPRASSAAVCDRPCNPPTACRRDALQAAAAMLPLDGTALASRVRARARRQVGLGPRAHAQSYRERLDPLAPDPNRQGPSPGIDASPKKPSMRPQAGHCIAPFIGSRRYRALIMPLYQCGFVASGKVDHETSNDIASATPVPVPAKDLIHAYNGGWGFALAGTGSGALYAWGVNAATLLGKQGGVGGGRCRLGAGWMNRRAGVPPCCCPGPGRTPSSCPIPMDRRSPPRFPRRRLRRRRRGSVHAGRGGGGGRDARGRGV